jgi:hypothetical protein
MRQRQGFVADNDAGGNLSLERVLSELEQGQVMSLVLGNELKANYGEIGPHALGVFMGQADAKVEGRANLGAQLAGAIDHMLSSHHVSVLID